MTQKLPGHLHAAYEWTEAAGELDGLKDPHWRRAPRVLPRQRGELAAEPVGR